MKRPSTKPPGFGANFAGDGHRRIYNTLVMLVYLLDIVSPDHGWTERSRQLIERLGINLAQMGFPSDFQTRPI